MPGASPGYIIPPLRGFGHVGAYDSAAAKRRSVIAQGVAWNGDEKNTRKPREGRH
jgi:hypothetical protein